MGTVAASLPNTGGGGSARHRPNTHTHHIHFTHSLTRQSFIAYGRTTPLSSLAPPQVCLCLLPLISAYSYDLLASPILLV
jgi:hypothetical protein